MSDRKEYQREYYIAHRERIVALRKERGDHRDRQEYNKSRRVPCPLCGKPKLRESKLCLLCAYPNSILSKEERAKIRKEKDKIYRQANKEKIYARIKKRRATDSKFRERINNANRIYHQTHKESIRIRKQKYHRENREHFNEKHREYMRRLYSTPKGKKKFLEYRKKFNESLELRRKKYDLLWIQYLPCSVCGSYAKREVDHIIEQCNGGTDDLDNLRVLCFTHHRKAGYGRHSTWKAGD
jgi:hypothetical protein